MEDDQHQEEISGEPSKQEGFPSGTEEPNSNEDLTIFTSERKPCSKYNSSPTKSVLTNMSPDSQATETAMHSEKSQDKPNWLHHVRDRLQCDPCDQMCSPKSDLEDHMNDHGHLRFIQESAEEEENARRHASLSANFRTRKLVQKTDKSRQEQKYHRKASDIQNRLSQAFGSQDDLQGGPGQSRGDPRLSRDGDIVRKMIDFMSEPASGTSQHDQRDYDMADSDCLIFEVGWQVGRFDRKWVMILVRRGQVGN